ncbi:hypothetical protein C8R31_10664 [Nitrosospira sp. Nsp2]|nr:hypothetical protein C8R31_10664 [Nitrosospira sp. Nsp2]
MGEGSSTYIVNDNLQPVDLVLENIYMLRRTRKHRVASQYRRLND